MPIKFTDSQVRDIIKLRTVDKLALKEIGKRFGCGEKPIARILKNSGISTGNLIKRSFTDREKKLILDAYESGIGANGIPDHLGLDCSCTPVVAFLKSIYGTLRNRSQQQQARMDRCTSDEKKALTRKANIASKGSTVSRESKIKRANTIEGAINKNSRHEPVIFEILCKAGFDAIPSKAVDIYNCDFGIGGTIAVEVFGGCWAYTDKGRVRRYIQRTKEIADFGFHTVFVMCNQMSPVIDGHKLIETIKIASVDPSTRRKYWVVWGDRKVLSGFCDDMNDRTFVPPFEQSVDAATGRYFSVK